jgi:hypothetical protein
LRSGRWGLAGKLAPCGAVSQGITIRSLSPQVQPTQGHPQRLILLRVPPAQRPLRRASLARGCRRVPSNRGDWGGNGVRCRPHRGSHGGWPALGPLAARTGLRNEHDPCACRFSRFMPSINRNRSREFQAHGGHTSLVP